MYNVSSSLRSREPLADPVCCTRAGIYIELSYALVLNSAELASFEHGQKESTCVSPGQPSTGRSDQGRNILTKASQEAMLIIHNRQMRARCSPWKPGGTGISLCPTPDSTDASNRSMGPLARLLNRACTQAPVGLRVQLSAHHLSPAEATELIHPGIASGGWERVHFLVSNCCTSVSSMCLACPAL
jgi:hypothetical protein